MEKVPEPRAELLGLGIVAFSEAGAPLQSGPPSGFVDVLELAARLLEVVAHPERVGPPCAELPQLGNHGTRACEGLSKRSHDFITGDAVELDGVPARQIGESLLDGLRQPVARDAGHGAEKQVEAKPLMVLADEVEHQARALPFVVPKPSAELLEKEGGALG